eukprot:6079524-Alexandrium_andersonii.AAC.1
MSGGLEAPPGLQDPETRPPPKRPRGATSAPPSTRSPLVPIAEEETEGGAPGRARPPSRESRS